MDHRIILILNKLFESHNVNLDLSDYEPHIVMDLISHFEIRNYKKGGIVSDIGNMTAEFFIVIEGILSNYFIKSDGNKEDYYTFITSKNKRITGSWEVEFLGKPSEHVIKAETDAVVLRLSLASFRSFIEKYPNLSNFYHDIIPKALATYLHEIQRRYNQKPEERYETLLEELPEALDYIPSRTIASYLGIAPESFSRMKKRLEAK